MRTSGTNSADMTTGTIWKHLVKFAVPMMIGMLFQQLYNTIDSVVVGRFVGKEALAAVGSTTVIINTLIGLFSGLSAGATVGISQNFGAKNYEGMRKVVNTAILMTFALGILFTILGIIIVKPMLRLMSTPEDVMAQASTYLRVYFCGISGLMLYNMGAGILRAVGDSKRPLYFLIFSALTNTVLDLVFVVLFRLGVAGVAIATSVSQAISAVLVLYILSLPNEICRIGWKHIRIDMPSLRLIFRIGLPSALQMGITSFSNVFVQSYVNAFGSDAMAGWSCYNKLEGVAFIPTQCISLATTTFVGQNFGAGDLKRARHGTKIAVILCSSSCAILSGIMIAFSTPLVQLFSTDSAVIEYGSYFIRFISLFVVIHCISQVLAGALRGYGITRETMIMLLISFVVTRQIYLYIATRLSHGRWVIAFAYPEGWICCTLLVCSYYLFVDWKKKAVSAKDT